VFGMGAAFEDFGFHGSQLYRFYSVTE
jgi:hypothetical protein